MFARSNLRSSITSITLRYDDAPPDTMTFAQSSNSTGGLMASAPMMSLHLFINPT